jgi:hypothetical protein
MVFSVSPSVTVTEVDLTATVPAVATPPAAFVGVFGWGPVDQRILITSENELVNRFGKPSNLNAESFFTAADYLAYSNALYVTRVVDNNAAIANETGLGTNFQALYPGELGNSIKVSYSLGTNSYKDETISGVVDLISTNSANIPYNTSSFKLETTEDITNLTSTLDIGDVLRVGNDNVGYQNLIISSVGETVEVANSEFETVITFTNRYSLRELNYSNLTYVKLWGQSGVIKAAPSAANRIHVVVIDEDGAITGVRGTVLEVYDDLSINPSAKLADGTNNYYVDVIANKSNWIAAKLDESGNGTLNDSSSINGYESFSGGQNGNGENSISFSALARGYDLYREASEIDISFILQGPAFEDASNANYIISNILETRKDTVLFISPRRTDVVNVSNPQTQLVNVIAYRNLLQNSSYWFMDSGYKYRYDKYNDVYRWTPLNGDTAGLASRIQPWESPAGYKRGLIKNSIKLAYNPNKEHRDQLYTSDINSIITQTGQGTLLFGDKTGLGLTSAFNRINVRRLFIVVEKAIASASKSFLFDFNDEFTQTQFKNLVDPFLRDIQGNRGITDFRVICDGTINTPQVIDSNTFKANIFIQPARTINYIQLTFVATRTGVEFDEIVGQVL